MKFFVLLGETVLERVVPVREGQTLRQFLSDDITRPDAYWGKGRDPLAALKATALVDPKPKICLGHPAGPSDPMGQTVNCDGTCRVQVLDELYWPDEPASWLLVEARDEDTVKEAFPDAW